MLTHATARLRTHTHQVWNAYAHLLQLVQKFNRVFVWW